MRWQGSPPREEDVGQRTGVSSFYIVHPNGREKLKATTKRNAVSEFRDHWTAKANWLMGKKPMFRRLIETRSEEILAEPIVPER